MGKSLRYFLWSLLAVAAIAVLAVLYSRQQQAPLPPVQTPYVPATISNESQTIDQDWISFTVPKEAADTGIEVKMKILKSLNSLQVLWVHPETLQQDRYTLQHFSSGQQEATYKINAAFGNFLPGRNDYTVEGLLNTDNLDDVDKIYRVTFSLLWNIDGLAEVHPELMSFVGLPEKTDQPTLEVVGKLLTTVDRIHVISLNKKRGKTSFRLLGRYHPGDPEFHYFAKAQYGNFSSGENLFVFEAYDGHQNLLSRRRVTVQSTQSTVADQVDDWFGSFTQNKEGWYVSSKLPWFSLRQAYDDLLFLQQRTDDNVLMPRPTLLYTAQAAKGMAICDYLNAIDYHQSGVVYRGNGFESCQSYRFGVSIFDRFVSILTYKPFDVVRRIDYDSLTDKVSSAFLMVETGGMHEREQKILSFDQLTAEVQKDEAMKKQLEKDQPPAVGELPAPRYYAYQFLLTEEGSDPGKNPPLIASQIPADRKATLEQIRDFLRQHSGDELFTPILFPVDQTPDDSTEIDSTKVSKD